MAFATVAVADDVTPAAEESGLKKFEHFITKYGHEALDFLKCMGPSFVKHCSGQTLSCLSVKNIVDCLNYIQCEEKETKACTSHLKSADSSQNE